MPAHPKMIAGSLLAFFRAAPPLMRRSLLRERVETYVNHPLVNEIRQSLPADCLEPFDRLVEALKRTKWAA